MAELPFYVMDEERCLEDMFLFDISFEDNKWTFLGIDAYCVNKECRCTEAYIHLIRLNDFEELFPEDHTPTRKKLLRLLMASWQTKTFLLCLSIDLQTRKLKVVNEALSESDREQLAGVLEKRIIDGFLEYLLEHKKIANKWREENWERIKDDVAEETESQPDDS